MRKLAKIINPEHKELEFTIEDFNSITANLNGFTVENGKLKAKRIFSAMGINLPTSTKKAYYVNGKFFVYSADKKLYVYKNGGWFALFYSSVQPYAVSAMINGEKRVLLAGDSAMYYNADDTYQVVTLPVGENAIVYKGMLFVSNANELKYSKLLDCLDFTSGLDRGGLVKTDENYGDIIALVPTKNYLAVVCEKAVYHLTAVGDRYGYALKRQNLALNIRKSSVAFAGDKIMFFSDNALFALSGQTVSKINGGLGLSNYSFDGQCGSDGDIYYAKLKDLDGDSYVYFYNAITGESIIKKSVGILVADGGIISEKWAIYRLERAELPVTQAEWQSVELDFGNLLKKSITAVSVKANTPVSLEITGDYGKLSLAFDKGFSRRKCFIPSKAYKLSVVGETGSNVNEIKFTYHIKEE